MRDYELTFIIDPELKAEDQKKILTATEKIITGAKGKVSKKDEWGRKRLEYSINKKSMGVYFCWQIKLPVAAVSLMDQKLRLEEKIIRYLLIKNTGGK